MLKEIGALGYTYDASIGISASVNTKNQRVNQGDASVNTQAREKKIVCVVAWHV